MNVLCLSKAHSTTQAFGESAEIVSCDQESELMSSLKRHVKSPTVTVDSGKPLTAWREA